jgi:protein arginine N-methyltransferase 3
LIITTAEESFWNQEKYLKAGTYEPWLTYDIESLKCKIPVESKSESEIETLKREIRELKETLQEKDDRLQEAAENIKIMKQSFTNLISMEEVKNTKVEEEKKKKPGVENGVGSVALEDDEGYFSSYSHYSIHHSMLSDTIRTESYRNAIIKNSSILNDKIVMDLGSGTSILSMFASQAGARKVYSVDQSEIIYKAMEIVNTNKIKNIEFVKGRIEDVEFPEKVDVIISEFMGYFLLFEGMLDSVIYARNNYLKDGGVLLPNRCNISIVGYGDEQRYNEFILFFKDVYSFNMNCMIKNILQEAHVESCNSNSVLTSPNIIADLDLMKVDMNCPNFSYKFSLEVTKPGKITSFVGYFDTFFELPEHIEFSTSPFAPSTHWKQTVFYLDKPYQVSLGEKIDGLFFCQRDRKDLRSLKIMIEVFGKTFKYDLN